MNPAGILMTSCIQCLASDWGGQSGAIQRGPDGPILMVPGCEGVTGADRPRSYPEMLSPHHYAIFDGTLRQSQAPYAAQDATGIREPWDAPRRG